MLPNTNIDRALRTATDNELVGSAALTARRVSNRLDLHDNGPMPDPKSDQDPAVDEDVAEPKPKDAPEDKIPGKPISDMNPPGQEQPEDPE